MIVHTDSASAWMRRMMNRGAVFIHNAPSGNLYCSKSRYAEVDSTSGVNETLMRDRHTEAMIDNILWHVKQRG